jgi:hypothetical protein
MAIRAIMIRISVQLPLPVGEDLFGYHWREKMTQAISGILSP